MKNDEERFVNSRAVSASIPLQYLRAVLEVHRDNCRQSGCLILSMLEARAAALKASGAP